MPDSFDEEVYSGRNEFVPRDDQGLVQQLQSDVDELKGALKSMYGMMEEVAKNAVDAGFARLVIQKGSGMIISGGSYNWTVGTEQTPPLKASGYATCDPDNPGQLLLFITIG